MKVKLFDSERKVMEVLWQGGELPAKDIARALADSAEQDKLAESMMRRAHERGEAVR